MKSRDLEFKVIGVDVSRVCLLEIDDYLVRNKLQHKAASRTHILKKLIELTHFLTSNDSYLALLSLAASVNYFVFCCRSLNNLLVEVDSRLPSNLLCRFF